MITARHVAAVIVAVIAIGCRDRARVEAKPDPAAAKGSWTPPPEPSASAPNLIPIDPRCSKNEDCAAVDFDVVPPFTCCLTCSIIVGNAKWVERARQACGGIKPACTYVRRCDVPKYVPKCVDGQCVL